VLPSFYNVGDTHTVSMLATQFSIDIPEPDDGESNKKLVNRCIHVGECWQEAAAKHKRMKPSADKDRRSRWMGSLYFTLLQIHSEMLHRGLISIESYYECHKPKEAPK